MKNSRLTQVWAVVSTLLLIAIVAAACTPRDLALQKAEDKAENRDYYIPVNGVEARNYNWRQEIADRPAEILWCTYAFTTPGSPFITVPIIGKLTSGEKRPFPRYDVNGKENVGSDGMFGSSGEYRYGFGPNGKEEYYDFYGVETFCTTMPLVWQKEATILISAKDPTLMAASQMAEEAIMQGNGALAEQILLEAIKQIQGGE